MKLQNLTEARHHSDPFDGVPTPSVDYIISHVRGGGTPSEEMIERDWNDFKELMIKHRRNETTLEQDRMVNSYLEILQDHLDQYLPGMPKEVSRTSWE